MPDEQDPKDKSRKNDDAAPQDAVEKIDTEPDTSELVAENESTHKNDSKNDTHAEPTVVTAVTASKKKSHKKAVIAGISGFVLLLLIVAGVLAYNFWYQNPDKVVADGLVHLFDKNQQVASKLTFDTESSGAKIKVVANTDQKDGKTKGKADVTIDFGDTNPASSFKDPITISADYAVDTSDGGVAYFKLDNVKDVVSKFVDAYLYQLNSQYRQLGYGASDAQLRTQKQKYMTQLNPVLDKLDNQWIKVSGKTGDSNEKSKCVIDAYNKLLKSKHQQGQVADAYRNNRFIDVDKTLGSKDGSLGYEISFDESKSDSFGDALEKTDFAKEVKKCDPSSSSSSDTDNDTDDLDDAKVQLWIDRWSHRITGISVKGDVPNESDGYSATMDFDYENIDDIAMPQDAKSIDDLKKDFQKLYGGGISPFGTSGVPTSI